jgi:hypothetical protein
MKQDAYDEEHVESAEGCFKTALICCAITIVVILIIVKILL